MIKNNYFDTYTNPKNFAKALSIEKLVYKHGITAFEQKLNHCFLRVNRSFLINCDKVTAYTKNDIEIGNIEIPTGDYYKENALKKLSDSLS